MLAKLLVIALLLAVIGSLASALVFLMRDRGDSKRTVRALTLRVGLSIAAFVLLLIGAYTGLITPHGLTP